MTDQVVFPPRVDVVGTRISMTSYDEVTRLAGSARTDRATVVAVCNVHSVMTARKDPAVHAALEEADVATPDGMPLVWAIRRMYKREQERVYGPEIMRRVLAEGAPSLRHFLYGSRPETLERLVEKIRSQAPSAKVLGTVSPPFRDLSDAELDEHLAAIRESEADVVWVGLGMPKQELWMARVAEHLPGVTLIGVGAAFDLMAGTVRQAPAWMQRAGLEWLFRLAQEPRRLWRRYLSTNPAFILMAGLQVLSQVRQNRSA